MQIAWNSSWRIACDAKSIPLLAIERRVRFGRVDKSVSMDFKRLLSRQRSWRFFSSEIELGRCVILLFTRDNTSRFVSLKIHSGTADNMFDPRNNLVTEKRNARELLESTESSVSLLKVKFKHSNLESLIRSKSLLKLLN